MADSRAQPAKKFVIKSFKNASVMDLAEATATFSQLSTAIDEIYAKNASTLLFEEMYRYGYNLILHKYGEMLYTGVAGVVRRHLLETVETVAATPNDLLMAMISFAWSEHKVAMNMVADIMMYMDRTYVLQHKKDPVYKMSLKIFREVVIYHSGVRDRLRSILLENITNERNGLLIDRDLMKITLAMLVDLGVDSLSVYEEEFEKHFLDVTRIFYRQESSEFLSQNTCPDYLWKAEQRLGEEARRVTHYLSSSSEPKLKHLMEAELINAHARTLVEMDSSGCVCLMRDDKMDDLKRMYALFSRIPSTLDILRDAMGKYIRQCGVAIVADQDTVKEPMTFVQQMLDLKAKFDRIIQESFRNEKKMQKKLKDAFEEFVNLDSRCASYLACYIDEQLKSGLRGATEDDAEQQLERVIVIFRFLADKDVFETFYRSHLAKRLLGGKSVSDEIEKSMIAKLKSECGQQFTSKMEGMFLDMNLSKEIMDSFKDSRYFASSPVEVDIQTLTNSHWSLKTSPPIRLPALISQCCDQFNAFYLAKFKTGRRLTWLTNVGSADMKANFPAGRREFSVTTFQMCLLLLFNEQTTWTLTAIRQACNIPESDLKRHLLSLCTPKLKILKKASKGKGITEDDSFTYNDEFTSKFKRIKVPLISAKEITDGDPGGGKGEGDEDGMMAASSSSSSGLPPTVEEDRRHLVEAAIVRVMKARKRFSHNDLVAEITKQLSYRFVPSPPFIKKRMESLIERDYLQRDKEDRRFYNYLA